MATWFITWLEFSPFLRQMFVALASQLSTLSHGGCILYPSVLLRQLSYNDSSIRPDMDTMSWIASMYGLAGIGGIMMPTIMQLKGRKKAFIGSCTLHIIGWLLAFIAKDAYTILLAEFFLGLGSTCMEIVNLMTISEMLAPRYRTVSMMLLGVCQLTGMVSATFIGSLVHWKTLALIMCIPVIIALIIVCTWPESPSWLAYKGKFNECEKAFTWLRGTDDNAKAELQALLLAQKEKKIEKSSWKDLGSRIRMKDFYMPSLHMILILTNFYTCGTLCLLVYGRDIMERATGNKEAAVSSFMWINLIIFSSSLFSLTFIRYLKCKFVLGIGSLGNLFLIVGALVSFLQHLEIVPKDSSLFIYVFIGYHIIVSLGFNITTFAVSVEIMPVKHRGIGGALYTVTTCFLHFSTIKSLPYLMIYLNVWGTLLLCSFCGVTCSLLIWMYVPETKNRTLQEIEDYYNYGTFVIKRSLEEGIGVPMVNK